MFETKKAEQIKVFTAQTDYIPLGIGVRAEKVTGLGSAWQRMYDAQATIDIAVAEKGNSALCESDSMPFIESNFLECLVPTMFGATPYESPGGLADVRPIYTDIQQTADIQTPDMFGGMMEHAVKHLEYVIKNAPQPFEACMSRFMSPLDYAVVMRGGDFYMDILLEPELAGGFMNKIADVSIACIKHFRDMLGYKSGDGQLTVRGFYFPGIRLSGDAVVNLSPATIKEVMYPIYQRFADEFGALMLHYCCTPAPSGHVLPALVDGCGITCVDNWQGYKTFFNENQDGLLQDKVGICTDLPKEVVGNPEKLFADEALFGKVKRSGGRALTVSTGVDTVEEGKRLYHNWREFFEKSI